ncbi:hypothetical protein LXA43DRAFT_1062240 [Ganoderma leucocontextum]|nr:hypothetical protein LXA43DRAFT_1062240 [Ganoderma leucocontextum]
MEVDNMWFKIAVECVGQDGFCKHPQCGEALLEYNPLLGECMRECADHIEQFSAPVHVTDDYRGNVSFAPNPVLYHVNFRPRRDRDMYVEHSVDEDAHLRVDESSHTHGQSTEDAANRTYIGQHPIAARSFATATPPSNIFLLDVVGWYMPSDPTLQLQRSSCRRGILELW